VKDRKQLIITKRANTDQEKFYIDKDTALLSHPVKLRFERISHTKNFTIPKENTTACVDAGNIQFPLILRKWIHGDQFKPFGMDGWKKVSDYFTDNKFSLADKENTWLLCSGEQIIWIVGHRLDERFKITPETVSIIQISLVTS
jgi:tRNA(Ile)-lysidine synthase